MLRCSGSIVTELDSTREKGGFPPMCPAAWTTDTVSIGELLKLKKNVSGVFQNPVS